MKYRDEILETNMVKAKQGDAEAQRVVAVRYLHARPGQPDYNKAVYWLRKSVKQNNVLAANELARLYHRGCGVVQDDGKALFYYQKAMTFEPAMERVQMLTMTDRGKKRVVMSLEEVIAAAEQGDAEALCELGWRHYIDWGVKRSDEEAIECFEKATKLGHAEAKYFLYWLYKSGDSRKGYKKLAAKYCMEAAEQGHLAALYHLGEVYRLGIDGARDHYKALEYYRKADENGHPLARTMIDKLEAHLEETKNNPSENVLKIMEEAEAGDAWSQRTLGLKYMVGKDLPADPKLTLYWLEKAAAQGERVGQHFLAVCYELGLGVEQNADKAIELYQLAGKQGYSEAYYRLGNMYKDGFGVEKDEKEAAKWYELAVELRHEKAMCQLGHLYADGCGVEKNRSKAYDLYWRAVEEGYGFAKVYLDLLE